MSDNYQAVYDAVRSKISGCDIDAAVRDVLFRQFDVSCHVAVIAQEATISAIEQRRPSVLFRPSVVADGNQWCALYGENLQTGVAGFGASPELAMLDFDKAWTARLVTRSHATAVKRHTHVNSGDKSDACAECGLDLRDKIHLRVGESA